MNERTCSYSFFLLTLQFYLKQHTFKKNNLGFTPCKTEQLLKGMELQEKEEKNKNTGKLLKEPKIKRCLLTLNLKPFRSKVKGKQSARTELQSLAVQGKKL